MSPDQWRRNHPVAYLMMTMLVTLPIVLVALFIFDKVSSAEETRKVVAQGVESKVIGACRSSFANADAKALARVARETAHGVDLFLALRAGVPLDAAVFTESHRALIAAQEVSKAESRLRGLNNVVCLKLTEE